MGCIHPCVRYRTATRARTITACRQAAGLPARTAAAARLPAGACCAHHACPPAGAPRAVRVVRRVGRQLQVEDCVAIGDVQAAGSDVADNQRPVVACRGRGRGWGVGVSRIEGFEGLGCRKGKEGSVGCGCVSGGWGFKLRVPP